MAELRRGVVPATMTDPFADDLTKPFWDAALEDRLVVPRCTNCGTFRLPPGPFCFACRHQAVEWVELPGTGAVYTFTVVRHPLAPHFAEIVPYVTAVVELDDVVELLDDEVFRAAIGEEEQRTDRPEYAAHSLDQPCEIDQSAELRTNHQ
jgi:uncharacterized OB-fold protein